MAMALDRIAERGEGAVLLVGRLAMAALFIPSGFGKLTALAGFAQSLAAKGLPAAMAFAVLAASVELFGGLAVALGFKTRYAALLMIAFVAVATLLSHRFWELHDAARLVQQVQFMKNLAIAGGFLLLFERGAGPLSLDRTA